TNKNPGACRFSSYYSALPPHFKGGFPSGPLKGVRFCLQVPRPFCSACPVFLRLLRSSAFQRCSSRASKISEADCEGYALTAELLGPACWLTGPQKSP